MCGISAALGALVQRKTQNVQNGLDELAHRGPDGQGLVEGEGYTLGHRRLAILGSAEIASQPFFYRGNWLVYNGEVHNYVALAIELRKQGHDIAEGSDVPVVAAALYEWGIEAIPKFDGFFAFIYVRPVSRDAIISRDRFGQKPLLYYQEKSDQGQSYFIASEEKALNLTYYASPQLKQVIQIVLEAQYPTAPASCFEGIKQFNPGNIYVIDLQSGEMEVYPGHETHVLESHTEDHAREIRKILNRSILDRLSSDVPVGLLLSAGVDSGCLRTLCSKQQVQQNFVFDNKGSLSELPDVIESFGNDYKLTPVSLKFESNKHFRNTLARMHKTIGAPLLSASLLALDSLFSKAKELNVPVLLSGQGADEMFAGYNYYQNDKDPWILKKLNRIKRVGGWGQLPTTLLDLKNTERLKSYLLKQHQNTPSDNPPFSYKARREFDLFNGPIATMLWYEDRLAMHHSIEVRYPFLALELLTYTASLSFDELREGNQSKGLLKAAMGNDLPSHLREPKPKRGLPSNERQLIVDFSEVFQEGIHAFAKITNTQTKHFEKRLHSPSLLGPRESKFLFRLACAGLWLKNS